MCSSKYLISILGGENGSPHLFKDVSFDDCTECLTTQAPGSSCSKRRYGACADARGRQYAVWFVYLRNHFHSGEREGTGTSSIFSTLDGRGRTGLRGSTSHYAE